MPLGYGNPCNAAAAGCPYDSLNVGLTSGATVGTDFDSTSAYLNSATAGNYCDGGSGGTSSFRLDAGCWTGFVPALRINAGTLANGCVVDDNTATTTMTLLADCTVSSTFTVPAGYIFDGGFHTLSAAPGFIGSIVANGGTSMTVRNLTVNGASNGSGCQPFNGIAFTDAGGAVSNVTVHNIRWNDPAHSNGYSGCQSGVGIIVDDRGLTGGPFTVSITGSTVDTYNKNGITVSGNVSSTIAHNSVVGAGPLSFIAAQNGVQVSYGASGTVTSNTVSNNWYTGPTWTACGLLFYQATGVKQSANVFSGNQTNICNAGRGGGNTRP